MLIEETFRNWDLQMNEMYNTHCIQQICFETA